MTPASQELNAPTVRSSVADFNRRVFDRVLRLVSDAQEHAIQRAVCVWATRFPPPVDRATVTAFPARGYMSFSTPVGRRRLHASLSVHAGEVRIGIVIPHDYAALAREPILDPQRLDPPTRVVDFPEVGVLFDWYLPRGACSADTMITALRCEATAEAVADYIAHRAHNLYFSVLEILAQHCGVTYTCEGAYERGDLDHHFFTVEGPEQPERVHERVGQRYAVEASVREEDGAWCYLVAAPKSDANLVDRFQELMGPGYSVKAHGRAQTD